MPAMRVGLASTLQEARTLRWYWLLACMTLAVTSVSGQEEQPNSEVSVGEYGVKNGGLVTTSVEHFEASDASQVTLLQPLTYSVVRDANAQPLTENNNKQMLLAATDDTASADKQAEEQVVKSSSGLLPLMEPKHDPLDEDLVNAVVNALERARVLGEVSGFGVDVQCNRGVVSLVGMASSPAQRTKLIEIASKVKGVFAVFESISILSKSQREALQAGTLNQQKQTPFNKGMTHQGNEASGNLDDVSPDGGPSGSRRRPKQLDSSAVADSGKDDGMQDVVSSLDRTGAGELEDRRSDTGNGLPLPNIPADVGPKSEQQPSLLKQIQNKLGASNTEKRNETRASLPSADDSRYQRLMKIIAAGETGQSKKGEIRGDSAPGQKADMLSGPGTMSLPKVKRTPRRKAKALPNVDLIPVDAMIHRGAVPDIQWVGNRTYPNELQAPNSQRIASHQKRSGGMGPPMPTAANSNGLQGNTHAIPGSSEIAAMGDGNGTSVLPSLLLPEESRSGTNSKVARQGRQATTVSQQQPLGPPAAGGLPPLPGGTTPPPALALPPAPAAEPPSALALPQPPVAKPPLAPPQQPIPLNRPQNSSESFNAPNSSAIESIPVPSEGRFEGSGVVSGQVLDSGQVFVPVSTRRNFKHKLFHGLCDGVCGGVCGCFSCESLSFGTEGTYLAPIGEGVSDLQVTNLLTDEVQVEESVAGFAAGQRFWAQLQSDNVGIAAEYWFLGNRVLEFSDYYVAPGEFESQSNYLLDLNVFDLEYFQQFCCCGLNFRASAGARYFELDRINTLHGAGKTEGVLLSSSSRSSYQSSGFGATIGLAGMVPIRRWGCSSNGRGWNMFWQLRGSVLDTDAILQARTEAHAVAANGTQTAANSVDEVHVSWEGATSNGMLQLGLAYQWAIPKCRGLGNVYLGFEGHLWQTAPVGLESTSQAFLEQTGSDPFGASIVTNTETNPDDLGFAGFVWGLALYH